MIKSVLSSERLLSKTKQDAYSQNYDTCYTRDKCDNVKRNPQLSTDTGIAKILARQMTQAKAKRTPHHKRAGKIPIALTKNIQQTPGNDYEEIGTVIPPSINPTSVRVTRDNPRLVALTVLFVILARLQITLDITQAHSFHGLTMSTMFSRNQGLKESIVFK
jgi:hypothetical protein